MVEGRSKSSPGDVTTKLPVFTPLWTPQPPVTPLRPAPSSPRSRAVTDVMPCFGVDEVRS